MDIGDERLPRKELIEIILKLLCAEQSLRGIVKEVYSQATHPESLRTKDLCFLTPGIQMQGAHRLWETRLWVMGENSISYVTYKVYAGIMLSGGAPAGTGKVRGIMLSLVLNTCSMNEWMNIWIRN